MLGVKKGIEGGGGSQMRDGDTGEAEEGRRRMRGWRGPRAQPNGAAELRRQCNACEGN